MDLAHKLLALTTVLLLALGAFFAFDWIRSHDDYVRAEAQVKADQSSLSQLAKQQSDLAAQLKQTQAEQQSRLGVLQKQYAQAQSPEQLAALISRVMKLPQPIRVTTPPATTANPFPTPVAEIPLPDAPQAKAFVQACQECQIQLATAQKQSAIAAEQSDSLKQELAITQQERDTWKRTARGGSWDTPRRQTRYRLCHRRWHHHRSRLRLPSLPLGLIAPNGTLETKTTLRTARKAQHETNGAETGQHRGRKGEQLGEIHTPGLCVAPTCLPLAGFYAAADFLSLTNSRPKDLREWPCFFPWLAPPPAPARKYPY